MTHKQELTMYNLHTEKQRKYFSEVIRLHYEEGYGEDRIARIIPIGHSTVSRWIAIFAKEKGKVIMEKDSYKVQTINIEKQQDADIVELKKRVRELERQLLEAEIKAEAYDELINVAEAKFRIPIRKKAGAKQ